MSVLTKLFIVLLVVSSLLLSAATVVFVNRVEESKDKTAQANAKRIAAENAAESARAVARDFRTHVDAVEAEAAKKVGEMQRSITGLESQIQAKDAQVAQLTKDAQVQVAGNKGLADAVKATQEENKGLQTAITDARTKMDSLLKENGELNTRVTELDRKNEQLAIANKYAQEKIAELLGENKILNAKVIAQGGGRSPDAAAVQAAAAAGPINGVVRSVEVIGGKKYATISVGSSDNVAKGMKFNVVNTRTGAFLGYLTVDSVQLNDANGQLEGKVDQIQAGVEVKTQL